MKQIIIWGIVLTFFLSIQEAKAENGFSVSLVKEVPGFLWEPANVNGTIYSGSYNLSSSEDQKYYYASNPSNPSSWKTQTVSGTKNHESTRTYNLNGQLYVTSEGVPKDEANPLTGSLILPGGQKTAALDHQFNLLGAYYNGHYLVGWAPVDTTKPSQADGTKLYSAPPGGGKTLITHIKELMAFNGVEYNGKLYLSGCDVTKSYKYDGSGMLVEMSKDWSYKPVPELQSVGGIGRLKVFDDKLFIATGQNVQIYSYDGSQYVQEKAFATDLEVGSMEVFGDKLFLAVTKQAQSYAEIWYRTKGSSTWNLAVSNDEFKALGAGPGGAGGLINASGWLVADSNALYAIFVKGSSARQGLSGQNSSYIFRITGGPATPTSCNLNFNPTPIELGTGATFSWNVIGTITYAFLACDQAGGVEVTNYIQKNPSGSVSGWTPTTTGTEICSLYLNGTTICQSNPLSITEPARASTGCTLDFNPGNIDLGQSSTLTWTTNGTFSEAKIECDLAGGGDIATYLQANPNDDIAWTPSSEGVETCRIYFNNANTASCESNNLITTDPAQNSAYRLPKTKQPKLDCAFTPANVALNEKTTLSWEATDIASLKAYCAGLVPIGASDAQIELPDFTGNLPDISLAETGNEYCYFNAYDSSGVEQASCIASLQIGTSLPGSCGTAMKTYSAKETSWGSATFCSTGNPNPETPTFPATGSLTTWICEGLNGGTDAYCTATRENVSVDCIIDDPSCAEKTCQDLYCFDGCNYLKGLKDCVGRR
jgi:hypothetical protein